MSTQNVTSPANTEAGSQPRAPSYTLNGDSLTINLGGRQKWNASAAQVAFVANGVKYMSGKDASYFIAVLKGLQQKAKEDAEYRKQHPQTVAQ